MSNFLLELNNFLESIFLDFVTFWDQEASWQLSIRNFLNYLSNWLFNLFRQTPVDYVTSDGLPFSIETMTLISTILFVLFIFWIFKKIFKVFAGFLVR